ncbi:MAG: DUF4959 domain-containing protein [Tannerella sp.]|jgi:hypothetical protein|nr:DUF4959 domain-containing protein [Tannerella sp.]
MYKYFYSIIILTAFFGCQGVKDWNDQKDDVPPAPVSNIKVESLNGGAKITYTLPADNDILGAKVRYTFHDGDTPKEIFASAGNDTIVINGYGDTNEHDVEVYALDKSMNVSMPVTVKVTPNTPPVEILSKSLKAYPAFGGIYVTWQNPIKESLGISIYIEDKDGFMQLYDTYFTDATDGKHTFKQFPDSTMTFEIVMRDRWNNHSTPLRETMTPLYETEIKAIEATTGKVLWSSYNASSNYRGDVYLATNFNILFDGVTWSSAMWQPIASRSKAQLPAPDGDIFPWYTTIDLGVEASYSNIRIFPRDRTSMGPIFSAILPKDLEIWGCNNPKAVDTKLGYAENQKYWTDWEEIGATGEWRNDWVMLYKGTLVLPSGISDYYDGVVATPEDEQYLINGIPYEMITERATETFRYLRFVTNSTNTGSSRWHIGEIKIWGAYKK